MFEETSSRRSCRRAAFLDRDGVINVDVGFAHKPEQLVFTPTAREGIRAFNEAGYWVIVVTNQSGVARGLYDEMEVVRFHEHITARLADYGAFIDAFYYCPYHPGGTIARYAIDHEDRKPRPGMLFRAMQDLRIQRAGSLLIGDRQSDAQAATAAGIPSIVVPSDTCDLAETARSWLQAHPV